MRADHPLSGLLRLAIIVIGVPWAITLSVIIALACLAAQFLSFLASGFIAAATLSWPAEENLFGRVACPRIIALWRGLADMWPGRRASDALA